MWTQKNESIPTGLLYSKYRILKNRNQMQKTNYEYLIPIRENKYLELEAEYADPVICNQMQEGPVIDNRISKTSFYNQIYESNY